MIYFFGCWDGANGHFLFDAKGRRIVDSSSVLPFRAHSLDGLLSASTDEQSVCAIAHVHHDKMWTIVACADYSSDSRPGSNAAIVREGKWTFDEMVQAWRMNFPIQFARINGKASFVLRAGRPAPGVTS